MLDTVKGLKIFLWGRHSPLKASPSTEEYKMLKG